MDYSKLGELPDSELVKIFQLKVDKKVFEELYNRYKDMIYSYVRKFLYRTPEDIAKEIMNEIFIKVYLELSSLKNPEAFKFWVYKIARSFCLKYIRSQKGFNISLDSNNDSALPLELVDTNVNLENDYINNEIRSAVFQEINKLDDKLREIIILKFFDNMTYDEISKITKIPDRTIRFKLKKAFDKISNKLKNEGYI